MKRGIAIFVCILTLVTSISCGQQMHSEDKSGFTEGKLSEDYAYQVSSEMISSDANHFLSCFCFQNDFLYFGRSMNAEDNQGSSFIFYRKNLKEGNAEEILFQKESFSEADAVPTACTVFPDGRVVFSLYENRDGQSHQMIQLLNPDGEEVYTMDITDVLCRDFPFATVLKCVTDNDDNIYLLSQNQVLVYKSEGTLLFSVSPKGEEFLNVERDHDGKVLVTQRIGMEVDASRIDVKKQGYSGNGYRLPENIRGRLLSVGENSAVLLDNGVGLCVFKPEEQTSTELFQWTDVGIKAELIKEIYMSDEGQIFLFLREITEDGDRCELCTLNRILKSEIPDKQVITIGTVNRSQLIDRAVLEFNRNNPEYTVEIVDYIKGLENNSSVDILYDAVQKLRLDILTGNAPDIIDFTQIGLDYTQLMEKGFVEDLYPYLDNSEELHREDFVQPVLEAYTTDGKLPCMPTAVYLNTLAMKKTLAKDVKSWTPEDFMALVRKQPADMKILDWETNMSILYTCMGNDETMFADMAKGEVTFDSEEFKEILEFASHFPETPKDSGESHSTEELLADNKLLFCNAFLTNIYDIKRYYADFHDDLVFIGYPSQDGQGRSSFTGLNALGISSQSKNKKGAWLFIQSLFTKEIQIGSYAWGIPVLQSVYDEKIRNAMEIHYELDENGNEIEVPNEYSYFSNGSYAITETEAEQFKELMENNCKVQVSSIGSEIYKILEEEVSPYFVGQKSLDEVVEILQNRVSLYISENQ